MQSEAKSALEEKWESQKDEDKQAAPSLNDAYNKEGKVKEGGIEQKVMDLIPQPTGWRIALLPY